MSIRTRWQTSTTGWRLGNGRVRVSNAWYRAAGRRISGGRQQYRNWLNRRAVTRGRTPLPDRITRGAGTCLPIVRDRINPATGRPRWTDRSDGALAKWRADREGAQGRDARDGAGPPRTPGVYELREHRWVPARDFRAPDLRARLPRGR